MTGRDLTTVDERSGRKGDFAVTTDDAQLPRGPDLAAIRPSATSHTDLAYEVLHSLTEDRDRIARDLNDILVHQMFAVSLDLHAALARIGQDIDDHLAAEKIRHAISGLDQAIRDLRYAVVGLGEPPTQQHCQPTSRS
jgi:signal transduction histidine kinase